MPVDRLSPEMRLFSSAGERLYLTAQERERFLQAADNEPRAERLFCLVLHYTGCRPSEALELTPARIFMDEEAILIRSLKKRKLDSHGRIKQPHYRTVPVPPQLIRYLDLLFDIRRFQKRKKTADQLLWAMSRPTAYRLVKRVMARANVHGKQATGKGLRHGFGVAMVTAKKPLPIHVLAQLMGHTDSKITEVYLQFLVEERRKLIADAWEG